MKEAVFIRQNLDKWKGYERKLETFSEQSPDRLADIYIDVTNDLSFAQSHYPNAKITYYLNGLAGKLHQHFNRKKKRSVAQVLDFWRVDVPLAMYRSRKELLISFIIFFIAAWIGAFSASHDATFARLILGDHYVDMTIQNILDGDPMRVYKGEGKESMFWAIMINNVRVSFLAFAAGIFTSLGTGYLLFKNGIMIGSFQYFFVDYGLLGESALTIWQHGTLEISAIIIAGCAGIVMGNGWLFPKTYTRLQSFRRSALQGIKIIVGTVPVFIVAAFIESYLTRHTDAPTFLRILLIVASLAFILYYYLIYPYLLARNKKGVN